jgi:hypothetical protein
VAADPDRKATMTDHDPGQPDRTAELRPSWFALA